MPDNEKDAKEPAPEERKTPSRDEMESWAKHNDWPPCTFGAE